MTKPIRLEKGLSLSKAPCKLHKTPCGYKLRHSKCETFIYIRPHEGETAHTLMEGGTEPTIMPAIRCKCGNFQGYVIDGKFLHA